MTMTKTKKMTMTKTKKMTMTKTNTHRELLKTFVEQCHPISKFPSLYLNSLYKCYVTEATLLHRGVLPVDQRGARR